MDVIRADELGMCFGVRDALAAARAVVDPAGVTVHGQLVHNPVVVQELRVRGFASTGEQDRAGVPETPRVLITAHGVSDKERDRLRTAGKELIDTTCPLVRRAHARAQQLSKRVDHVVLIGRPGHVEVVGIVEDLPSASVVPDVASVEALPFARLGVVCQTTTPPAVAAAVHAEIVRKNPHAAVEFADTVCRPTRDHQRSLEALLPGVDAVVVVGGAGSNNTRALAEMAERAGVRAVRVAGPEEVSGDWLRGARRVGLTAGTSTLPETVDAVERRLLELAG